MGHKVLLLNFPHAINENVGSEISIFRKSIKDKPTLHDFHAILIDLKSVFNKDFWEQSTSVNFIKANHSEDKLAAYGSKIKEQIETGGITFCFTAALSEARMEYYTGYGTVKNRFCIPPEIVQLVNENGDTFYPKVQELKYFTNFIKHTLGSITYECYFSNLPNNAKILGVNRAEYPLFAEVQIGRGKIIFLPRFKNMTEAATTLIYDVLPQLIQNEDILFAPKWTDTLETDLERNTKKTLGKIEKAKRLLYTKDKPLKKAVASAFELLGFSVNVLPDGTNADIEIVNEEKAICEIKGHENRQSDRKDLLQLLGYSTEDGKSVKSIFVSNHEFLKEPSKRRQLSFTEAAIDLGKKTGIALVSSVDLYNIAMKVLGGELSKDELNKIRMRIMSCEGIVELSSS